MLTFEDYKSSNYRDIFRKIIYEDTPDDEFSKIVDALRQLNNVSDDQPIEYINGRVSDSFSKLRVFIVEHGNSYVRALDKLTYVLEEHTLDRIVSSEIISSFNTGEEKYKYRVELKLMENEDEFNIRIQNAYDDYVEDFEKSQEDIKNTQLKLLELEIQAKASNDAYQRKIAKTKARIEKMKEKT